MIFFLVTCETKKKKKKKKPRNKQRHPDTHRHTHTYNNNNFGPFLDQNLSSTNNQTNENCLKRQLTPFSRPELVFNTITSDSLKICANVLKRFFYLPPLNVSTPVLEDPKGLYRPLYRPQY